MKEHWLFPPSIQDAKQIQREMAEQVVLEDQFNPSLTLIAGLDVSNNLFDPLQKVYAAAVLLSYPILAAIETGSIVEKQEFPYITGLLGFREAPALVHAVQKLSRRPDLILVDGHGVSHPRGLGIASHLGVLLDLPTIGVAKSILVGKYDNLGDEAGSEAPLLFRGKVCAMMLRSKQRCKPLIISAGHKISLETAVRVVKSCLKGYRLPEPTRQAHLAANACRVASM